MLTTSLNLFHITGTLGTDHTEAAKNPQYNEGGFPVRVPATRVKGAGYESPT